MIMSIGILRNMTTGEKYEVVNVEHVSDRNGFTWVYYNTEDKARTKQHSWAMSFIGFLVLLLGQSLWRDTWDEEAQTMVRYEWNFKRYEEVKVL